MIKGQKSNIIELKKNSNIALKIPISPKPKKKINN